MLISKNGCNKNKIPTNDDLGSQLSSDDMNTLQHVLQNVRGAYPVRPYRQADFVEE